MGLYILERHLFLAPYVTLSTSGIFATDDVNTVSIVGLGIDLLGNAAKIGYSSSKIKKDGAIYTSIS